jgi:hypothetical protein
VGLQCSCCVSCHIPSIKLKSCYNMPILTFDQSTSPYPSQLPNWVCTPSHSPPKCTLWVIILPRDLFHCDGLTSILFIYIITNLISFRYVSWLYVTQNWQKEGTKLDFFIDLYIYLLYKITIPCIKKFVLQNWKVTFSSIELNF